MNLRNKAGDGLIYAIRAGDIDDKALMSAVTVEELADFFVLEAINERACSAISKKTERWRPVTTVNDLAGVDLLGDASFRNALSAASKRGSRAALPGLSGPTRPPKRCRGCSGPWSSLARPSFPSVRAKLRFAAPSRGRWRALYSKWTGERIDHIAHLLGQVVWRKRWVRRPFSPSEDRTVSRRLCLRVASAAVESGLCIVPGALPGPDCTRDSGVL